MTMTKVAARQMMFWAAVSAIAASSMASAPVRADDDEIARGKYLVTLGGCNDCHTAGYRVGKPDMARYLGGADFAFETPGLGFFVPPNLTPDKATGLGDWSREEIVTALQTGARPDGRILSPVMPWRNFASMTKQDAFAVAAYLQALSPVDHKVPGPFGIDESPTVPVLKFVPPRKAASSE